MFIKVTGVNFILLPVRTPRVSPNCACWLMIVSAGVSPTMIVLLGLTPSFSQMNSALWGLGLEMESLSSPQRTMSTYEDRDNLFRNSSVPSLESEVQIAILISKESIHWNAQFWIPIIFTLCCMLHTYQKQENRCQLEVGLFQVSFSILQVHKVSRIS